MQDTLRYVIRPLHLCRGGVSLSKLTDREDRTKYGAAALASGSRIKDRKELRVVGVKCNM